MAIALFVGYTITAFVVTGLIVQPDIYVAVARWSWRRAAAFCAWLKQALREKPPTDEEHLKKAFDYLRSCLR